MLTTIEVTSRAIRLCREDHRRITALESYPIPPGSDPLQALAAAPLPSSLGRVRLVLHHADMLLRTMVQPPCPVERLGKIVRFELANTGELDEMAASWHLVAAMGSGDMRLLTLVTKRKLIQQVRDALKPHGGKLDSLIHPAIGLYQAYRAMEDRESGASMLVDIGGSSLHLVLVQDGELVFMRTQSPGMDELVKQVGELRGLAEADAAALVAKLGKGAPNDMHEAIKRQVGAVASVLTANIRFAKAQLRIDQFEPKSIWIAGAGAQVHAFAELLSERMATPVRALNPFSGTTSTLSTDRQDRLAALPSPWTVAIGAARAKAVELDALNEERERRVQFWRTHGALRAAAVAVASLFVIALCRQELTIHATANLVDELDGHGGNHGGLVPKAEEARADLIKLTDAKIAATAHLNWLDGERRPGRVAVEMLSAIAEQENHDTCPVYLQTYKVSRQPGLVLVEIEGFAEGTGKSSTDVVLHAFEQGLIRRYPAIASIKQLPKPIDSTRQLFHYLIAVSDQPLEIQNSESFTDGGKPALRLSVNLPPGADADGVARVAATRARTKHEAAVVVKVIPGAPMGDAAKDPAKAAGPQDITISFKD